jgi:S1-C subfamily serine protease
MTKARSFARTPFGSALVGGLVVAVLGSVALAAGWVQSEGGGGASTTTLAASALTEPTAQQSAGKGLTVNQIYQKDSPGVAFIQAESAPRAPSPFNPFGGSGGGTATGSGFVIDTDGHILTNAHVVNGADKIEVTLGNDPNAQPVQATVVGKDESTDVALLKVNVPSDQLHPLALGDSSQIQVGDPVVAIGNPFGLDRTVTGGIVSALQREIKAPNGFTISNVIQTDAAINPGNSGGPLIDAAGRVVGINSQIETGGSGNGNVGIGFAVPINTASEVVKQLLATGEVQHAFLGISGTDVTSQVADVLNLPVKQGALVQSVVKGGPADKAGIQGGTNAISIDGQQLQAGGDIIVSVDGNPVTGMDDVISAINAKKPGDQVELGIVHGSNHTAVTVTLGNRPSNATAGGQ